MGRRFFEQAEMDLQFARKNVEIGGYYVAAYLAHQAAAKALKAAHWHLRAEEPAWGHQLADVAERISEHTGAFPAAVDMAIGQLEPIFEQTRYPSGRADDPIPADLVDEHHATRAVAASEEEVEWVKVLLKQPHGRTQRPKRS